MSLRHKHGKVYNAVRLPQPGKVKVDWAKRKGNLTDTVVLHGQKYPVPMVTMAWLRERTERDGEHLIWQGTIQKNGSPQARIALAPHTYKTITVRKLVWANAHPDESVPDGFMVVNTCRVWGCVSPSCCAVMNMSDLMKLVRPHLPLSHRANLSKARSKDSRISDEDIARMRYTDIPLKEIAAEVGVNPSYPAQVRRGTLRRDYRPNPFTQLIQDGRTR